MAQSSATDDTEIRDQLVLAFWATPLLRGYRMPGLNRVRLVEGKVPCFTMAPAPGFSVITLLHHADKCSNFTPFRHEREGMTVRVQGKGTRLPTRIHLNHLNGPNVHGKPLPLPPLWKLPEPEYRQDSCKGGQGDGSGGRALA